MKYLFLDFDGVLHPSNALASNEYFINLRCLVDAVGSSQCSIVISSSWRFSKNIDEMELLFPHPIQSLIVGVTGAPYIGAFPRYNEIRGYLKSIGKPLADWRALDDSHHEFPNACENLIRCNPNVGLTRNEGSALKMWLAN